MSKRYIAYLFLATLTALCAACVEHETAEKEPAAVVNAQTIVVTPQTFTERLNAIGTVVVRTGHIATLSAPTQSRVERVLVTNGEAVRRDQPLIELDRSVFQAALQAATVAVTVAERANERQQRLASEGITPKKDADAAAADLAKAQSDLVTARRTAELAVLRSPIDGVITKMTATLGAPADPSQPLVEISDPVALDVLLDVTPADASRVRRGANVILTAGTAANGESLGTGSVADVASTVDSSTRSVSVRVKATAPKRVLKIGETVLGAITVGRRANAIVIPNDALVPDGEAFKVLVVDDKGIAHDRPVTIAGRSEVGVEVSSGLKAGERIVTTGAYGVSDSAKVQPLKSVQP